MTKSNGMFPTPHAIETLPGTEGWERMYPYQYQFVSDDQERHDYEKNGFWFYDGLHYPEPLFPFDTIWDEAWYLALSQFNTRIFAVPPVYGVDHRIVNGYVYITPVPVKDPAEIEKRIGLFMERAGYYYENWNELESNWETKMRSTIAALEALRIDPLPDMEELSVVTSGLGESKGYHLLKSYDDLIDLGIRCWQYHFEFLNLGYAAYVTFMDFCQKIFPDIPTQRITQMISGIDVIMYKPDEKLKELAQLAMTSGIDAAVLAGGDFAATTRALGETEAGRAWLQTFEETRYPWFNISTGTGWYHHHKAWNDDLNIPLSSIRIYIEKLRQGDSLERPIEAVRAERDRITVEYRALIDNDEDRATFDQLLQTATTVFPYVENHLFYVEHWFHSVFWNKVREVGVIMRDHGLLADVEDIWYLKRGEIKDALWDLVTAWATGVKPRGAFTLPKEIAWRKGVMQKFQEWSPPPAVGIAPEVIQEPFTIVLWGVTNDSLKSWAAISAVDNLDDIRQFTGFAGSPGSVQGRVRVCRTVEEIGELEEGEILVAPTTSPSWAPVFTKIQACVTDVGGVMSHAAIVCREYGMPAVVGTGMATKILKTGQMVSVNGSTGEIAILQ